MGDALSSFKVVQKMRAVGISQELPEDQNYVSKTLEKHKNHNGGKQCSVAQFSQSHLTIARVF